MILYTNDTNHKKIHINESQIDLLREDVFVNKINHKKANLTYNKRNSTNRIRNIGNYDLQKKYNRLCFFRNSCTKVEHFAVSGKKRPPSSLQERL